MFKTTFDSSWRMVNMEINTHGYKSLAVSVLAKVLLGEPIGDKIIRLKNNKPCYV